MKNKVVGYIILGFSLVIGLITYIFNRALAKIVDTSCSHGLTCPMWGTLEFYTNVSTLVMIFIIIIGFYLIFKKDEKEIIIKTKKIKVDQSDKSSLDKIKESMSKLNEEEKQIVNKIIENQGSIFQSDLVEKTNMHKVKVTRILDRLEGLNLIERKRRGMTNIVILKH